MTNQHSIDELIEYEHQSLAQILKLIDANAQGICFIVNKAKKLVGVVTDGDIRRGLLAGVTLDTSVCKIMSTDFISLPIRASIEEIQAKLSQSIRCIPLVDEEFRPVDYAGMNRMHQIPVMEPLLNGNELEYVTDCIKTGWISSQGKFVRQFESVFSEYCSMPYALAVSNGTVALHLALEALGVGEGDEVIVPDITFAASINAIIYTGATPVIVDVSLDTWTLDLYEVKRAITERTKAIMPVHLYGHPCDMDPLLDLAKKHHIFIIEDCAEALGSLYKGRPVGSFGDAATFSFFGNKTITTGEGGMVLLRDKQIYDHAHVLRDHGMSRDKKYWHDVVGYNYRMTNLQGAIGVAQMERLPEFVESKRRIANFYNKMFASLNEILCPPEATWSYNSYWLYTFLLNDQMNISRDELISKLLKNGIESRRTFYGLHEMPIYKQYIKDQKCFSNSELISKNGINLPSSVTLSSQELERIGKAVKSIIDTSQMSFHHRDKSEVSI